MMKRKLVTIVSIIGIIALVWIILYFFGPNSNERYMTTDFDMDRLDDGTFQITGLWDEDNKKSCRYVVIKPKYTTDMGQVMNISAIGEGAFEGLTIMDTVYIPTSVEKVGRNAFAGCTGLTKVNYQGDEQSFKEILIESGNDALGGADISYNAEIPGID